MERTASAAEADCGLRHTLKKSVSARQVLFRSSHADRMREIRTAPVGVAQRRCFWPSRWQRRWWDTIDGRGDTCQPDYLLLLTVLAAISRKHPGRILEERQRLIAMPTVWGWMPKPARTRTKACEQCTVHSVKWSARLCSV